MLVPSPSFAVMVVKIHEPDRMVPVGIGRPGLEEVRMAVDRSKVGVGEVDGMVKEIGNDAVREKRGRKKQ